MTVTLSKRSVKHQFVCFRVAQIEMYEKGSETEVMIGVVEPVGYWLC